MRVMAPRHDSPRRYEASLATILKTAAVPYGVTLTVWASGAALTHLRGSPNILDIFLFVIGGMAGYTAVALAVVRALEHSGPASPGAQMALTGLLHLVSIGAAVGAVTMIAHVIAGV